uniref:X-ray radiation resistance associated 1 n=1 Tax=Gopherus evgoodei TaxID=1825980 RepID=A0A8C4VMA6_9SAUR
MSTTKLYKQDNGNSYATNCFPARNILRTSEEGNIFLTANNFVTPQYNSMSDSIELQLSLSFSFFSKARISKQNHLGILAGSTARCQLFFQHKFLIRLFSLFIHLEAFRKFSGLRELELSLNGLRNLKISAGDFLHLEILDLSYNNLSSEDVRTLGVLSQLKVLHLTANGLRSLPSDLAVSENSSRTSAKYRGKFPSLEVLLLDDNYLSHLSVFVSLANLRSLKQLNLDKNGIAEVPYLHQMENSQFSLHPQSKEQLEYLILQNNQDPDRTGNSSAFHSQLSRPAPLLAEINGNVATDFSGRRIRFLNPWLSLSRAMYQKLHAMIQTAIPWRRICVLPGQIQLILTQSPCLAGDPPLLTSFLQHRLGIKLIRRKISKLEKPHIFIPVKANRKVTSHVPMVPKQPLMLEAPLESSFWKLWLDTEGGKLEESEEGSHRLSLSDPLPPIRPSSAQQHQEPYDDTKMLGSHKEVPEKEKYDSKLGPASLDDADDIPSSVWRHELEDRQGKRKHKSRTSGSCTYIPTKYKGYEELLRVKTDPEFIEPVGMQQNVQALRRALKQPLVYRDSKARLDSVQKPYVPRRKKMGKPPGPPSRKTKAEVLEDILLAMRGNMNIREVPLGISPLHFCSLACKDCDRTDLCRGWKHLHSDVFEIK